VNKRLKIENHTIKSMPKRMKRLGEDPLRPVLEVEPDLLGALERLTTEGSAPQTRDRHADHFARFAVAAGDGFVSADQASWIRRIDANLDNLRAAAQ